MLEAEDKFFCNGPAEGAQVWITDWVVVNHICAGLMSEVLCSKKEMLEAEDKFFCDACQGLQEAHKWLRVQQYPPILCCHLKRFKYDERQDRHAAQESLSCRALDTDWRLGHISMQ